MKKNQFKKLAILGILVASIIIGRGVLKVSAEKNIDNDMKCTVQEKIKNWSDYVYSNPAIFKLSNPYEYFKNEKYKEIKMLGPEYLPYILEEIENSNNARLLIWAIDDISNIKFKKLCCSNGEFVQAWNEYIDNLPNEFNTLKNELENCKTQKEIIDKEQQILELGSPVLPLVIDEVISGNEKMKGTVNSFVGKIQGNSIYKGLYENKELKVKSCKKVYNEKENEKLKDLSELKIDANKLSQN